MCIICVLPEGTSLTEEEFENCWDANSDGFGMMFVDEHNKLQVHKTMEELEAKNLYSHFRQDYQDKTPFILHFRIATHGSKDESNCHPFYLHEGAALCHNGIIPGLGNGKDNKSDTREFVDDYLRHLPRNWYRNIGIRKLVIEMINYSKLVILERSKHVEIINEYMGIHDNGRWFSNDGFKHKSWKYQSEYDWATTKAYEVNGQLLIPIGDHAWRMPRPDEKDTLEIYVTCKECQVGVRRELYDTDMLMCRFCVENMLDVLGESNFEEYRMGTKWIEDCIDMEGKQFC